MKASKQGTEWLGQPIDPLWAKMAREKNGKIMRKYAKGSVPVELVCFIIVLSLFIGFMLWVVKVAFEVGLFAGVWLGSHI